MRRPGQLPSLLGKGRTRIFVALVACGMAQAVAAAFAVGMTRLSIDGLGDGAFVWPAALGLAVAGLCLAGLRVVERGIVETMGQNYAAELRARLLRAISRTSAHSLSKRRKGAFMLRFVGDLTQIRGWVGRGLSRVVVAGLTFPALVAALAFIDVALAVLVGAVMLAALAATLALGPRLGERYRAARSARGALSVRLVERMGDGLALRFSCDPSREVEKLERLSLRLRKETVDRARASALVRGLPDAASGIALAIVVGLGAHKIAIGSLTVGGIVAAVAMVGLVTSSLRDLAGVQDRWRGFVAARERLQSLLSDVEEQPAAAMAPASGAAMLTGEALQPLAISRPITAILQAGQSALLSGASGTGKTTLLLIAGGLARPMHGRFLLDGIDVTALPAEVLARSVGFVSPELAPMKGKVRDLLRARAPGADSSQMSAALERSGSLADLEPLGGLHAKIAEGGRNLPLSQRLRLSLAIALVSRPRLLLVDEADLMGASGLEALAEVIASRETTVLFTCRSRAPPHHQVWQLDVADASGNCARPHLNVVA